jgi:hypothetical protein
LDLTSIKTKQLSDAIREHKVFLQPTTVSVILSDQQWAKENKKTDRNNNEA